VGRPISKSLRKDEAEVLKSNTYLLRWSASDMPKIYRGIHMSQVVHPSLSKIDIIEKEKAQG